MKIVYRPIGFVHSPHQTTRGTPIQPSRARGIEGTVEIEEEYVEALSDLDGFSHIILICHLHKATGFKHKVVPYLDTELRGLFATRAPSRPNPIGFSVVRLLGVDGHVLRIEGVDLLDGTPVLDIKPEPMSAVAGWTRSGIGKPPRMIGSKDEHRPQVC